VTSVQAPSSGAAEGARRVERRRLQLRHALAAPNLVWALLFFFVPIGFLAVYSFGQMDIITFKVTFGWTLDNYERLTESLYVRAILRSLAISLGATLCCLVIGYPVAYVIARQPPRRQTLLLLAVVIPFWTSFVVRTYGLVNLLSNEGPIAGALRRLGLLDEPLQLLYSPLAVTIGIVYTYLPLMILPLYVVLERIDPDLPQAASDLGSSSFGVFRRVVLPLSVPGIIAGCILVGAPATGEYTIPIILGGDKTLVYGNVVADQFLKVGDYAFGSALAMTLMAIVTLFLVVGRSRLARAEEVV
jgi:ABC-type spermidine/putrescine transport system permease subunit I